MNSSFSQRQFLIIGGTTKAGTTSLYRYLSDHPQVCASSLKETRFFLDADSPIPRKIPFDEKLEGYTEFFSDCIFAAQQVMVEATPDYLYSNCALRIAELLPNAKIVFILRDPVARLVSWYKYARQRGQLANKTTFPDYVQTMFDHPINAETPSYLRALVEGRYMKYIAAFEEKMPGRVLILSFDELSSSPEALMKKLCAFSGLDAGPYRNYSFSRENVSKTVKYQWLERVYSATRRYVSHKLINIKWAMPAFRWINRYLKKILRMNQGTHDAVNIDEALARRLREYYADDMAQWKKKLSGITNT